MPTKTQGAEFQLDTVNRIEQYEQDLGIDNRSETLRRLVRAGLEAEREPIAGPAFEQLATLTVFAGALFMLVGTTMPNVRLNAFGAAAGALFMGSVFILASCQPVAYRIDRQLHLRYGDD